MSKGYGLFNFYFRVNDITCLCNKKVGHFAFFIYLMSLGELHLIMENKLSLNQQDHPMSNKITGKKYFNLPEKCLSSIF